jgi:protein-tyrosine phosphatase
VVRIPEYGPLVTDLHCHVLPGIDDGPETIEGSVALARAASAAGAQILVATSHVCWNYRNDARTIRRLVAELNARLAAEKVALEVRAGAEIAMTRVGDLAPQELSRLTLGGSGRYLLIEPPFTPMVSGLEAVILDLQRQGYRVVLAHPERCPAFHRDRSILNALVDAGVLTSVTAGSLVGRFGRDVRRFALDLVRDEMVHNVASDAHDHIRRPPGTATELDEAGLTPLAHWFTIAVPGAILSGTEIPPRPQVDVSASRSDRRTSRWRLPRR